MRKQVLYGTYSGIADVSGDAVTLDVDEAGLHSRNWAARPRWIPDTALWAVRASGLHELHKVSS